jgi:CheY-like chemotaxis protein
MSLPAAGPRPGRPALRRAGRVLVVDDDATSRDILARLAEHGGYGVVTCADADSAAALLAVPDHGFGAVVTDVQMPGRIDGLGLARWIAAAEPDLAVIVVSASDGALDEARGIPSVVAVIAKPDAPRHLLGHLRAVLGR